SAPPAIRLRLHVRSRPRPAATEPTSKTSVDKPRKPSAQSRPSTCAESAGSKKHSCSLSPPQPWPSTSPSPSPSDGRNSPPCPHSAHPSAAPPPSSGAQPHAVNATARADATVHRTFLLGRSVDGHTITAVEMGDPDTQRKTLVVGCIHGNERAGIAIAKRLISTELPAETDLWIVTDLN